MPGIRSNASKDNGCSFYREIAAQLKPRTDVHNTVCVYITQGHFLRQSDFAPFAQRQVIADQDDIVSQPGISHHLLRQFFHCALNPALPARADIQVFNARFNCYQRGENVRRKRLPGSLSNVLQHQHGVAAQ